MANEGSTKPTWVCVCGLLVSEYSKGAHVLCDVVAKRVRRESEAELARVRGLLQRGSVLLRDMVENDLAYQPTVEEVYKWLADAQSTFPQSSSLVPEGAESADIGKLDTVDKKANV